MLNAVTFEKTTDLCACNSAELTDAMSRLRRVEEDELPQVFAPYRDSQTSLILRSSEIQTLVEYLAAAKDIEQVFIDYHLVKAFTGDSLTTYVALRRDDCFELYCSKDEPNYMW